MALVVLVGIVLETGSSCVLYAALGSHAVPTAQRTGPLAQSSESEANQPPTDSTSIAEYCNARLTRRAGSRLAMGQIQRDYEAWCQALGLAPMERREFMRELRREGRGRGWSIAVGVVHHAAIGSARQGSTTEPPSLEPRNEATIA